MKMKNHSGRILRCSLLLLFCLMMCQAGVRQVSAQSSLQASSKLFTDTKKAGWVKQKNGQYLWRKADGSYIRKKGWQILNEKKYYLLDGGYRAGGWQRIHGKYYYFYQTTGVLYAKKGMVRIGAYRYYIFRDGSAATGMTKFGKYYFYFSPTGKLVESKRGVRCGTKYYNTTQNGLASEISYNQAMCERAANEFIRKHSSASDSNAVKFRKCFNYLVAYMRYSPGYFSVSGDYAAFQQPEWQYKLALQCFQSPDLRGNCHRFACCVAAIAKELGYRPYVIVTTGDHSFVMIDGKYYDNMGPLFGASGHSSYSIHKKVAF